MAVFLSRRWKRQPQHPVGVDWGNPLTNRLSDVFAPTLGLRGAVSNIALTAVTSIPPIGAGRSGTGWTNSGLSLAGTDGVGLQAAKIYDTGGPNPITLFAVFEAFDAPSTSGNGAIVWSDSCMLQYHHASAPHQNCFDTYNSSDSWKSVKFSTPVANTIYVWVGTVKFPTASAYTNGVLSASATHSAGRTASTTNFFINTRSGGNNWNGRTYLAGVANRCWTAEEVASFSANPWQLFAPVRRRIFFDAGAAAAITGTLTGTLDAATSAATGTVLISGTAAPTFDAATLAATGTLAISGMASVTLDAATLAATGSAGVTGAADVTLDAATVSATGTLAIAGATTQTLADATAAGTGALAIAGALTGTLDAATLAATGVIGTITTGALDATLEAATVAATGALAIAGTATQTLADATAAATGTVAIAAVATVTLDAAAVVAAGNITVSGALAQTLAAATLAATGGAGTIRLGALAVTLADVTAAARLYPSAAGPTGTSGPLHRPPEARRAKQAAERRPPNRR